VVSEFALAVVLISGAGLLLKSFVRLMHVDPGFNPQGLLTMRISFPASRNTDALFHSLEERLRQIPGVDGFATTNALPVTTGHGNAGRFNVPGSPLINPDSLPAAQLRTVSPDYFKIMRIPLRHGRTFTIADVNQPVVIINDAMARRFWPGKDPVGLKFVTGPWGPNPQWSTIVGVVGDVKQFGLDSESSLDLYYPQLFPASLIVHTTRDPASLAGAMRREIQSLDPSLPISEVRTMDQVVSASAESRRWTMTMLAAFAATALILALVGIYGVISWTVAQRTREIGIRAALGARSSELVWNFILHGLKLCALGLVIGLAGAFALRQVLATQVFDVSTSDPLIYTAVVVVMVGVALAASYIPARRASRVDPLTALRWE
jgi:predicted permease